MQIVSDIKVKKSELKDMSTRMTYGIVKAVVDVERKIMAIDAEMHADQEQSLIDSGSKQHNLWGINLHPDQYGKSEFIEFDSMINIRPTQGNMSRGVDDPAIQKQITNIVDSLVSNE